METELHNLIPRSLYLQPKKGETISTLIIIPSTGKTDSTFQVTKRYGLEAVVIYDPWRNASKTRNYGVYAFSEPDRIDTLVFMDDDISFPEQFFYNNLNRIRNGSAIFMDPPLVYFIKKSDFIKTGGFDERFSPTMAETDELKFRMQELGIDFQEPVGKESIEHFGGLPSMERERLLQRHLMWVYRTHWKSIRERLGLFRRKNPIEFGRRILWFLEWLIVFHTQKRSVFLR